MIKPTFLIDRNKTINNILNMKQKMISANIGFRPHFKTHQSHAIGNLFKEVGIGKITVSSLSMAEYFLEDDWQNITIAFPFNLLELDFLNEIKQKFQNFNFYLLFDNLDSITIANKKLNSEYNAFLKIDTGYHRAGIDADDIISISQHIDLINHSKNLNFVGFLSHAGHTYKSKSINEIQSYHLENKNKLINLKKHFGENLILSTGDSPSALTQVDFTGIDELRPGVFVFNDLMINKLTKIDKSNISVAVACPVISHYYERNQILIYGGAVHLSKDYLIDTNCKPYFGEAYRLDSYHWETTTDNYIGKVSSISQEHGLITLDGSSNYIPKQSEMIAILPIHSCLTADKYNSYLLDGDKVKNMNHTNR